MAFYSASAFILFLLFASCCIRKGISTETYADGLRLGDLVGETPTRKAGDRVGLRRPRNVGLDVVGAGGNVGATGLGVGETGVGVGAATGALVGLIVGSGVIGARVGDATGLGFDTETGELDGVGVDCVKATPPLQSDTPTPMLTTA